jgi:hypothetical protein
MRQFELAVAASASGGGLERRRIKTAAAPQPPTAHQPSFVYLRTAGRDCFSAEALRVDRIVDVSAIKGMRS